MISVISLIVGLLGGIVGGAMVLGTSTGDSGFSLPTLGDDDVAKAPVQKGSVAAVARRVLPSTVQVRVRGKGEGAQAGSGSGFVVDRAGHIVTNNHVTEVADGGGEIVVVDSRGRRHDASLVGSSPAYDIAVVRIEGPSLRPISLGASRRMNVGDTVVAVGSPLGLDSTVTTGIVSALDRPVTTGTADSSSYISAVQTDAAINPGNSGGPLVDLGGRVIGVNSAIATTGGFLGGEGGNIGVGFAIPIEQVRTTSAQILKEGHAEYPIIGATVQTGGEEVGAVITEVPDGSPASDAGLEQDDRIVAVEGESVPDGASLIVAIRNHQPGERIELTVRRDGDERDIDIVLDGKIG